MATAKGGTVIAAKPQPKAEDLKLMVFNEATAIATADPNIPEYLRQQVGNRDGAIVDQDDLLIPRLAIAQAGMSPQLKKHNEAFIPGLAEGQLFNTVTQEIYGEKVLVVPLTFFKNFIEFKPMSEGGGVIQMYGPNDVIPTAKLAFSDGKPPAITEFKNRLCLLIQEDKKPELIVVSFKSSGLKAAKKWNSLIKTTGLPAYARSYVLQVKNKIKGEQSWYILDVQPDRFVPENFFKAAQAQFAELEKGGFKIDQTGLEDEDGGREPGDDNEPNF